MKLYSVHLCGKFKPKGNCYTPECQDIELNAETRSLAETYALARYTEYDAVRVVGEWNPEKKDWEDYQ